jgi:hypothetical protein
MSSLVHCSPVNTSCFDVGGEPKYLLGHFLELSLLAPFPSVQKQLQDRSPKKWQKYTRPVQFVMCRNIIREKETLEFGL